MGYDKRSLIIRQLQSNRSILNPKRMNKLIYKAFYFFNIPTGDLKPIVDQLMPLTFFLTFRMVFVSFRLETLTVSFWLRTWQPMTTLNVGRAYFDFQFFKQFESYVFQF